MTKILTLTTLLLLAFNYSVIAQNGSISGQLVSEQTSEQIPYATVKYSEKDGVYTNQNGEFSITNLSSGD